MRIFWIWSISYTNLIIWMTTILKRKVFISSKIKPSISHARFCAGYFHSKIQQKTNFPIKQQKNPQNRSSTGILHLGTTLSCDNKSIFRLYYSITVATLPDPTVCPLSRITNALLFHHLKSKVLVYQNHLDSLRHSGISRDQNLTANAIR